MITLGHILALGAVLFCISLAGIFLNRKNIIVLLMSIELMLLSVNINFVGFSREMGDTAGLLHPDRGRGRGRHRPRDPGNPVPYSPHHQCRRSRFAEGLIRRWKSLSPRVC
jgi:hypothetical protein